MQLARKLAILGCVLNVLALSAVQFAAALHPPFALYAIFCGVWLFGVAMLLVAPRFGAIGTALYGVILAIAIFAQHGNLLQNDAIAALSLATTGAAAWSLRR